MQVMAERPLAMSFLVHAEICLLLEVCHHARDRASLLHALVELMALLLEHKTFQCHQITTSQLPSTTTTTTTITITTTITLKFLTFTVDDLTTNQY